MIKHFDALRIATETVPMDLQIQRNMAKAAKQSGARTWRIHLTDTYVVRFTGRISRWQRLCLWCAGIDVVLVKEENWTSQLRS